MKIFSWVHRQFHHKVAKNVDNDNVALLENEAFDGWNEGILAIGTFGVDLFHNFKVKEDALMSNNALFFDDDDYGDQNDDEMEPSLELKASKHVSEHVEKQNLSPCNEVAKLHSSNHQEDVGNNSVKIMRSRERITLADLLRADSEENAFTNYELCDDHQIKAPYHTTGNDNDNGGTNTIKSFLISKVLKKQHGRDNSDQSIKRTKQLMRKMLRKKIHPDIGIQKLESPSIACRGN